MRNPIGTILRLAFAPCSMHAEVESHACERRLTWAERVGHWGHLGICGACRLYRKHLRQIRAAAPRVEIGREFQEGMPEDVRARLAAKVRG